MLSLLGDIIRRTSSLKSWPRFNFVTSYAIYASTSLACEAQICFMFVSGIAGSCWKSYRLENFASDFCLQLLAEIGTDPGCLIVIELASPCQIAAETLLKEDQHRKVEFLALEIHSVHNDSGTVNGGPSSRDSPTSLALSPSASLALELQFGRLRWGEESIAAS